MRNRRRRGRIARALLGLLLLPLPPVPADAAVQPIDVPNGSFETAKAGGNFPDGWEGPTDKAELVADAKHGAKALHLMNWNTWDWTKFTLILGPMPEGEKISAAMWVKMKDVTKSSNSWETCWIYLEFQDLAWQTTKEEIARFDGTREWAWVTKKKINVPKNLRETKLVIAFDGVGGQLWLDRFTLVKGEELPPETVSTSGEVAGQADTIKTAINRARAAIRNKALDRAPTEALAEARGAVAAATLLADDLEREAREAADKADPRGTGPEKAAQLRRAAAVVREKVAEAVRLIEEGEAAQKREAPGRAEEISSEKAGAALVALQEAERAADEAAAASTESLVLVATWGGGIHRNESASKWIASNPDERLPYARFIVAARDGRLYAGSDQPVLRDSDDNGKTWSGTPTALPAPATGFLIDPAGGSRWLITTWGQGAFLSTDEGRNWTPASAPSKFLRAPRALRVDGATRVYLIADDGEIHRAETVDGEWRRIATAPRGIKAWDLGVSPSRDPRLIAATDAGLAEITAEGKFAFIKLNVSTVWARTLATDLDRMLIGTAGRGIVEWRPDARDGPKALLINDGLGNLTVSGLVVSLTPKAEAVAGTEEVRGPRVWTDRNAGLAGGFVNGVAFNPQSEKVMFVTTRNGIFKSEDAGATWKYSGTGLAGLNVGRIVIDPKNPANIYTAPAYINTPAGIQKSSDGGKTWFQSNKGLTATAVTWVDLDRNNPGQIFAVTWGGGIFKSDDSAGNWYSLKTGITANNGYCIIPPVTDPRAMFAGTAGAGLYRFNESAWAWEASGNGISSPEVWHLAQDPFNGLAWLAGTPGAGLFKSDNSGKSWRRITKGLDATEIYRLVYHPTKKDIVYLGTKNATTGRGGAGVFRSVDAGENWAPDNLGLPSLGIEDLTITTKGLVYVATQNGLYYKQD